MGQVISQYNERIERIKEMEDLDDESDLALRLMALDWEEEYVLNAIEADEIPPVEGYQYVTRIARVRSLLTHGHKRRIALIDWWRRSKIVLRKMWIKFRRKMPGRDPISDPSRRMKRIILARSAEYVINKLQDGMADSNFPSEKISALSMEYRRIYRLLRGPAPSVTTIARNSELDLELTRLGLRLELEQIQQAYEEGRISRSAAQKMRENVYLMQLDIEDFV